MNSLNTLVSMANLELELSGAAPQTDFSMPTQAGQISQSQSGEVTITVHDTMHTLTLEFDQEDPEMLNLGRIVANGTTDEILVRPDRIEAFSAYVLKLVAENS